MNLQDKYFNYIKNGTKRIELRLFDQKRRQIKIGDIIEFNNKKEKLKVKVTNLIHFNTFKELIDNYDINILSSNQMTKQQLLNDLETYYTKEQQSKYGVIGIQFELCPKVLTIKEPWASLIINGYKEYEFRSIKTNYRGKILIQSSKSKAKNISNFDNLNLDYGCGEIIGEVTISDCIKVDSKFLNQLKKINPLVYDIGNYKANYAYYLTNVKKYKKRIKCQGKLGIWNYEGEL